jgi:hypothetical protein
MREKRASQLTPAEKNPLPLEYCFVSAKDSARDKQ